MGSESEPLEPLIKASFGASGILEGKMDTRDPLDVRFDEWPGDSGARGRDPKHDPLAIRIDELAVRVHEPRRVVDPVIAEIRSKPSLYPKDTARASDYVVEHSRSTNSDIMRSVDRDAFLRELGCGTDVSAELAKATIRAFLAAALSGPHASTSDGWHAVVVMFKKVVGNAISIGIIDARLEGVNMLPPPPPPTPRVPPLAPWAIMGYEARRPTPAEIEADLAYWQGLPVRLVETLLRAHVAARFRADEGATPEGRSRILAAIRQDLWDAVLDAVKSYPCPKATPPSPAARKPRGRP